MIFLSCPYSHKDPHVVHTRYARLCEIAGAILKLRKICISPNIYGHGIIQYVKDLPSDWEFWKEYCYQFIIRCDEVWVIMMPGWEESTGVQAEIAIAKEHNIPIFYKEPEEFNV